MSNVHGKNAIKYYKVTNEEALKTIHEFFEKRTAFLNRVQDFIKDFNLKSYVLRDNLFFGIQLCSVGVSTSELDQYDLVTEWEKDTKNSNKEYTALFPRMSNDELYERFIRAYPREYLLYNEMLDVVISEPIDILLRGALDHVIYVPNKCLLIADQYDYAKKPVCEEISKEELKALMENEFHILASS